MGICECSEFSNTGFPCGHICLLNYKGLIEEMSITERWWKGKAETGKQTVKFALQRRVVPTVQELREKHSKDDVVEVDRDQDEDTSMEDESEIIRV
jgi:hypothetical protein